MGERSVRQGVSVPIRIGLESKEAERQRFLKLARRFKESSDPAQSERLREELAKMIFGE